MQKQQGILDRVTLPTWVVVNRPELTPAALAEILQSGELVPGGAAPVCELKAGGQVLARGRIVRRRGQYWFKVAQTMQEVSS